MSIRPHFKHGIARLTAAAEGGANTRLTQVSHKAPMRLVPVWKSSIDHAGAAVCALSNYGGGMLQGDSVELHVNVKPQARLGVTTQGASRIYTQRVPNVCQASLDVKVDKEALLVWAPDPCALFKSSSFQQVQRFTIDPSSSVALIDWFSSGRYRNGEHWVFDSLSSRTSLAFEGEELPILQDAMHLDLTGSPTGDPLGVSNFHAFASLILYGDQVEEVKNKCLALSDALLAKHTRIRNRSETFAENDDGEMQDNFEDVGILQDLGLAGRVCMGISKVDTSSPETTSNTGEAHVVRLAATTNEDLYRVFNYCLQPLQPSFGLEFYKERIRAKASEIPPANALKAPLAEAAKIHSVHTPSASATKTEVKKEMPRPSQLESEESLWSALMLADSALPTGSFAHSSGLEVAAQIGLLSNSQDPEEQQRDLETFIKAATRSTIQVTAPFLEDGHRFWHRMQDKDSDLEYAKDWIRLGQKAQAVLSSNAPACAASLDQGKSLARVGHQWLETNLGPGLEDHRERLITCFSGTSHPQLHLGPVLGALGASLGLSVDQLGHLLGYCAARDIVSAAVRLSLVGPLASVQTLQRAQVAAQEGWAHYQRQKEQFGGDDLVEDPLTLAAASAPVLEAIHPCHEALQVRLFRS